MGLNHIKKYNGLGDADYCDRYAKCIHWYDSSTRYRVPFNDSMLEDGANGPSVHSEQ